MVLCWRHWWLNTRSWADYCTTLRNEQRCGRFFYVVPADIRTSIALFAGSQAPPICSSHTSNIKVKMITEHWWDDTDRGKLKFWDINRSQCHFVHHKSHTDCTDNELGPPHSRSSQNHGMGLQEWPSYERRNCMTCLCGNKMPTRCNRWFLLQILLLARHVSGIIRSSRVLYRWSLPVVLGALVFKLSVWCGAEGYVSGLRAAALLLCFVARCTVRITSNVNFIFTTS